MQTQANVRQLEAMESFKTDRCPLRRHRHPAQHRCRRPDQCRQRRPDRSCSRFRTCTRSASTSKFRKLSRPISSPGLKATFDMPQYPGQKFDATLVTTSNAMDATSRSMLVELQADNADGKLFGGRLLPGAFPAPGRPEHGACAGHRADASQPRRAGRGLGDDNKAVLKTVQLGRDFGDSVEVTAGLAPQDQVIDSPPETLRSGDPVQLAATMPPMASAKGATQFF